MRDREGRALIDGARPITEAGIALALGFMSVESLRAYEGRPCQMAVIRRAYLRLDQQAEEWEIDQQRKKR